MKLLGLFLILALAIWPILAQRRRNWQDINREESIVSLFAYIFLNYKTVYEKIVKKTSEILWKSFIAWCYSFLFSLRSLLHLRKTSENFLTTVEKRQLSLLTKETKYSSKQFLDWLKDFMTWLVMFKLKQKSLLCTAKYSSTVLIASLE